MKYVLVGVDDTTNLSDFDALLHTHKEVKTVEIVETTPTTRVQDADIFNRNLVTSGMPLSDNELDILSEAMEADKGENGISFEVVIANLEQKITEWSKEKA